MAGKKISELASLGTTYAATDLFEISKDTGGGTYASKKITGAELSSSITTSIAIGDTITSATAGSVLFAGAAGVLAQDNAKFFWDDTNNRLGIGTATPGEDLHLSGSADQTIKVQSTGGNASMTLLSADASNAYIDYEETRGNRWIVGGYTTND